MAAAAEVQVQAETPAKLHGLKQLEQLVRERVEVVQSGLQGVETELRSRAVALRKSLDEAQAGAVKRVSELRSLVSFDALKARMGAEKLDDLSKTAERLIADGVRQSEVFIAKLGLERVAQLPVIAQLVHTPTAREAFGRVQAGFEALRSRFEGPQAAAASAAEKNPE